MSGFKTSCPHCSKTLKVKDQHVGKVVKCPACGDPFEVQSIRSGGDSLEQMPNTETFDQSNSRGPANDQSTSGSTSMPGLEKVAAKEPTLETLGRFKVKQLLGEGGFGRVYRAYDPQLDRFVALKVPTFPSSDKQRVKRFLTEAKAAAQLRHPNIVPTFDSGQAGDKLYIAGQFINGQALNDRIKDGKIKPRDAARWIAKIADAVHYAHQQGIVHRDIKPHNVMLDEKNEPQLMDFGLAKRVDEESTMTVDGSLMGTPAYMSPEQAKGDHKNVGPASDQYSVGVMLYELLTAKKPFSGPPHSVIKKVIEEEPRTVQSRNPRVSKDLDAICLKAMEKDASRRYDSAATMAEDLDAWLDGRPIQARKPGPVERATFWVKRNPLTAGLSTLLAAALIIGTAVSIWFAVDANKQKNLAQTEADNARIAEAAERTAKQDVETQRDKALAAESKAKKAEADVIVERDAAQSARARAVEEADRARTATAAEATAREKAESTLAQSNYLLGVSRWENDRASDALRLLEQIPNKYRKLEWHLAKRQFQGERRGYRTESGVAAFAIHHEGGVIATIATDFNKSRIVTSKTDYSVTVRMLKASTGKLIRELKTTSGLPLKGTNAPVPRVQFSADGTLIVAVMVDSSFRVWRTETGELVLNKKMDKPLNTAIFTPDGTHLILGLNDDIKNPANVVLWNIAEGKAAWSTYVRGNVTDLDLSDDGTTLAVGIQGTFGSIHLMDVADSEIRYREELKGSSGSDSENVSWIESVDISPDGQLVAAGRNSNIVDIWKVSTGRKIQTLDTHTGNNLRVRFSPDNRFLATTCGDGDDNTLLWDARSGRLMQSLRGTSSPKSAQFMGDGRCLVTFGEPGLRLWKLDAKNATKGADKAFFRCSDVAYSRDGKRFATAANFGNRDVVIWNADTVQPIRRINAGIEARSVHFSPDGKRLVTGGNSKATVWNADTGIAEFELGGHKGFVRSVRYSPDGKLIATTAIDHKVKLWDAATGEEKFQFEVDGQAAWGVETQRVRFSPNSKILLSNSKFEIYAWDVLTGDLIRKIRSSYLRDIQFSPDGKRVVAADNRKKVRVFDFETTNLLIEFVANNTGLTNVAYSPDGERLITCGGDGLVKIWNASNGEELRKLKGHSASIGGLAVRADGMEIVSADANGNIRVWSASEQPAVTVADRPIPNSIDTAWHTKQATQCFAVGNPYAELFHRGWLLKAEPDSVDAYVQFRLARDRLTGKLADYPVPTITNVADRIAVPTEMPERVKEAAEKIIFSHWPPQPNELELLESLHSIGTPDAGVLAAIGHNRTSDFRKCIELSETIEASDRESPFAAAAYHAALSVAHAGRDDKSRAFEHRKQFLDLADLADDRLFSLSGEIDWMLEKEAVRKRNWPSAMAAIELGGKVFARIGNGVKTCGKPEHIPGGPFALTKVSIGGKQLPEDFFLGYQGLMQIRHFDLQSTNISQAHLSAAPRLQSVTNLGFYNCLELTDEALVHLQKFPALQIIHLHKTQVSDAGMKEMARLKNLNELLVVDTKITDAGLAEIAKNKSLRKLNLKGTYVTAEGVMELHKSLPKCRIEWNEGVVAPVL